METIRSIAIENVLIKIEDWKVTLSVNCHGQEILIVDEKINDYTEPKTILVSASEILSTRNKIPTKTNIITRINHD